MVRLLLVFCLLVSMPFLQPSFGKDQAQKEDWNKQIGWVTVPVFYVTDRNLYAEGGGLDYGENQQTDRLNYGIKNVLIPYTLHLDNYYKELRKMGWKIVSMDGQPHNAKVEEPEIRFPDTTYTKEQFFIALENATELSDRKEILLHVHGCCTSHKNAMVNAAKLEGWYRVPLVVYDWTSPDWGPTKTEYFGNEKTVKIAQAQFDQFAIGLEKAAGAKKMAISAHSMGNRLLDEYLLKRKSLMEVGVSKDKFKEVMFASADVSASNFAKHAGRIAANSRMTRIYISSKDPALAISEMVHIGDSRLGKPNPKVLPSLCVTDKMDVIDETELFLKHDLPEWLIANMHRYGRAGERNTYDVLKRGEHLYVVKEKKE